MSAAVTFAATLPTLLVTHHVADHWAQTDRQAADKGLRGWPGRRACAAHIATYTLATASAVCLVWGALGLTISPLGFLLGQLVSATTHYWADRRFTLRKLCDATGKGAFYRLGTPRPVIALTEDGQPVQLWHAGGQGLPTMWDNLSLGTGAYALDQSWHWAWLFVAALATAVIG